MSARIIVDHLTRMRDGHICVAGLSDSGTHLRPQLPGPGRWLRSQRWPDGPFQIGALVDLGATRSNGHPPEVEDRVVLDVRKVSRLGRIPAGDFFDLVKNVAAGSLSDLFGPDLARTARGAAAIPQGHGSASLGCLLPVGGAEIVMVGGAVRLAFEDPGLGPMSLSLTDLRLVDADHRPVRNLIRIVAMRLGGAEPVVLSVGLSRALKLHGVEAHWLQVNNIHFPTYLDDHPAFRS